MKKTIKKSVSSMTNNLKTKERVYFPNVICYKCTSEWAVSKINVVC
jgi:hypothetical protein